MIETAAVLALVGLFFAVALPVLAVAAILALALKVVCALVLLPIKAIGWGVSGLLDGAFFLLKALGVLVLGAVALPVVIVLIAVPAIGLAPILLLAASIWLAWRMVRPARAAARP